ncbi:hypothetical protein C8Q75DRAFT_449637 [Abortiporus biennis]|nr:hypothetical protein C8Q75DRAFT_449637 [Abortiporus biennis]
MSALQRNYSQKTYSRRALKRRKQEYSSSSSSDHSPERPTLAPTVLTPSQRSQKRRKIDGRPSETLRHAISDEEVSELPRMNHAQPSRSASQKSSSSRPKSTSRTSLASTRSHASPEPSSSTARALRRQATPISSEKTVKDLSDLFNFSDPPQEHTELSSAKPRSSNGGVVRRMLRRTRTDTSLSSSNASQSNMDVSVPIQVPSTPPKKLVHSRTESFIDLTSPSGSRHSVGDDSTPHTPSKSRSFDDTNSPPARPLITGAAATSNIRTYGGKSRSFLVALPSSKLGMNSHSQSHDDLLGALAGESQDQEEDDLEVRESYAELRARWGVDNSEDDLYPPYATVESPSGSPSGKRKGKGKEIPRGPLLPPNMMNDLKSISELRSKGETRRFLDEMGYLFEGLDEKGALSVRRGSALELVTKLCDEDFVRRAKAADFFGRAWEALRKAGAGNGDKVLDTVITLFSSLLSKDPRDLSDLATKADSDFASTLLHLLDTLTRDTDPLWLIECGLNDAELKRAGIGKLERANLQNLIRIIRQKSALFEESDVISNRLLLSLTLNTLPPHVLSSPPRNSSTGLTTKLTSHLSPILSSLEHEIASLASRLESYTSGLPLFPNTLNASSSGDTVCLKHVDHLLRLIDAYLLGQWTDDRDDEGSGSGRALREMAESQRKDLANMIGSLLVYTEVISNVSQFNTDMKEIASKCQESTLRVLINLSHQNSPWCQTLLSLGSVDLEKGHVILPSVVRTIMFSNRQRTALTKPSKKDADVKMEDDGVGMMGGEDDEGDIAAQLLDRLCLGLGLLTNLVQVAEETKDLVREIEMNPSCTFKRSCTLSCQCPVSTRINGIDCLALVYKDYLPQTASPTGGLSSTRDEVQLLVRGHISVLFGLLLQNPINYVTANQRILLASLPGTSNKAKVDGLIESAKEFWEFYVRFTRKVEQGVDEDDDEEQRDEETVRPGGRMLKDREGEDVARDVVKFFEALRERC